MLRYVLTRLLWIPIVLTGLSLITFGISRLVPGDPVKLAAGPQARPEQIQKLAAEFGLDRPLPEQYLRYMGGLAQGNWGYSISNRRPVLPDLLTYFAATLELTIVATIMGLLVGFPLAVVAARWRDLWPDHVSRVVAIGAVSIPIFWIAIILQVVFGQVLHWFPVSGRYDPRQSYPPIYTGMLLVDTILGGNVQGFFTSLRYMFLPAVCQSLLVIALVTRQLRGDLLDLLRKDFVMVARANGIKERIVWTRYLMKNAMIATVSMLGFVIAFELGGNVLIEAVFDWPGIGQYATKAALTLDFQVIMGVTLFIGVVVVFINLFTDVVYRFVDPRIRFS